MESPVSAFSMYKNNNKRNKAKKLQKQKRKMLVGQKFNSDNLPVLKVLEVKQKLNRKNKHSKQRKDLNTSKKKKARNKNQKESVTHDLDNDGSVDEVDAPTLILPPLANRSSIPNGDASSSCSNSSCDFSPVVKNSVEEGLNLFKWLIAPYDIDHFMNSIWEKKPGLLSRGKPDYYKHIISTPIIDKMLRNENIMFTKNIDVTSYRDGQRETHNPEGRAHPHVVWDFYMDGCSIRLLNPQTFIPKLHVLNATLQEYFNSFVGANAYLTPPDSQGFAPHYDDIEAFIIQVEGSKQWKIYKPINKKDVLPRHSSKNFNQEEVGDPILEVVLKPGDLLYFPRGYIHQALTIEGEHSLHVTISMYQKHSWADLFEKLIPAALQNAITEDVEFRKGLPLDIYENFGLVHSDLNAPKKKQIGAIINNLFNKIKDHLPIDCAVDEMSKEYQRNALPPVLTNSEKLVTVYNSNSDVMIKNGKVVNRVELDLDTKVRLLRKNILRLVSEGEIKKVYYHTENSLEYQGNEIQSFELPENGDNEVRAITSLLKSYPEYISVDSFEFDDYEQKLQLANYLWERGLIMTEYPLEGDSD